VPSTSRKQHMFMQAVANNPAFAKKVGVPQSVGQEFSKADKGRKFSKGGETMANTSRMNRLEELGRVNAERASTPKGKSNLAAEKKRIVGELKYAKGGSVAPSKMGKVKTAAPSRDGAVRQAHTKGKVIKMAGSSKGMMRGGKC
jgi:hypothetical protein